MFLTEAKAKEDMIFGNIVKRKKGKDRTYIKFN
jgi:hypothetical protein